MWSFVCENLYSEENQIFGSGLFRVAKDSSNFILKTIFKISSLSIYPSPSYSFYIPIPLYLSFSYLYSYPSYLRH